MILTPKAKEYGKRMQVIAMMYINKNAKLYKATEEGYESSVQMIFDDAQNLYAIGGYMLVGNFDAAMSLASEVATAVRDEIPNSVWNYLEKFTVDQE